MKRLLGISYGVLCLSATGLNVWGSEAGEVSELPAVVVTANRDEVGLDEVTASVTVIDKEVISRKGYHMLPDLLREVPGVTVVRSGTPGQPVSLQTRGTESNHTLVLMNGRRIPSGLLGGFDLTNMPLDDVERVEIVRGAGSLLYGDDAIGGVINLITKSARGADGVGGSFRFEAGSFQSFRETLDVYGKQGVFDFSGTAGWFDTDHQRENNEYQLRTFSGRAGVEVTEDFYADVMVSYRASDAGNPGDIRFNTTDDPNDSIEREVLHISPGVEWQTTDWWQQRAHFSYHEERQVAFDSFESFNPLNPTHTRLQIETQSVDYQSNFQVASGWRLMAGASFENQDVYQVSEFSGMTVLEDGRTSFGFFLNTDWEPVDDLILTAGVRFDQYSDFDDPVTFRVGGAYTVPWTGTRIHANYGTAYVTPTVGDRSFPGFSNPNVSPEESKSWEVGVKQGFLDDRVMMSAVYFQNELDDLIQFTAPLFIPVNVARARTEGVELELQVQPSAYFEMSVGYTYLDARNLITGGALVLRPRNTVAVDLDFYPSAGLSWNVGMNYVNGRESGGADVEDYLVFRSAVSYEVNEHVSIFGRWENVLNEQYAENPGYESPDTAVYGGFKVKM